MINYRFPKDVIDEISSSDIVPPEVKRDFLSEHRGCGLADYWLASYGRLHLKSVRKYFHFVESMHSIFIAIHRDFKRVNKQSVKSDTMTTASSSNELALIASYLYILKSYGVEGDFLECGCYKGYSSCCLSFVCDYLGIKLIIADSFEGLPDNAETRGFTDYKPGEYCGSLDEVREHLALYGKPSSVEFVKGFFSDTLKDLNRPLCALWMDVDLYQSATDVLENAVRLVDDFGLIFSHEMPSSSFEDGKVIGDTLVCRAFRDYFNEKLIGYFLHKFTGVFTANPDNIDPSPQCVIFWNLGDNSKFSSVRTDFSHMRECPDFTELTVTSLTIDKDNFSISGWAIDGNTHLPLSGLFLEVDGELIPVQYGMVKNSLLSRFKSDCYKYSGFKYTAPPPHCQLLDILIFPQSLCA